MPELSTVLQPAASFMTFHRRGYGKANEVNRIEKNCSDNFEIEGQFAHSVERVFATVERISPNPRHSVTFVNQKSTKVHPI
jgi:hypothetical protein